MENRTCFAGLPVRNYLIAASSPLTESVQKVKCCMEAGFGGVILKSAADYVRTGKGYGRKVVFIGDDYYADSSFEREIMTAEEAIQLYKKLTLYDKELLIIPSISASSMRMEDWMQICQRFEDLGAQLLQLDFFYLGTLVQELGTEFYPMMQKMLSELCASLDCKIMPKLNVNFEPARICETLVQSGVKQVSLLDSIRVALPEKYGLHENTTSYFGNRQLPLTLEYLQHAVRAGLEVCAGGGVCGPQDVDILKDHGAALVQTASYVLKNGFSKTPCLLHQKEISTDRHQNAWCDIPYYQAPGCENCGFCFRNSRHGN